MKRTRILLIAVSFILFAALGVESAQLTIPVTQTATVDSLSKDSGSLLFKFDLPEELNGAFIDYAELLFRLEPEPSTSHRLVLAGFPLKKDWNEDNLSWNEISSAYVDTLMATCLISREDEPPTWLDITEIVRLWVEQKIANFGVVLMDLDRPDGKLKLEQSSHFPEGIKAQVRIFYTAREVQK